MHLIAYSDAVWAALHYRAARGRVQWFATCDRGLVYRDAQGDRSACRDTGLPWPMVRQSDLLWQALHFRDKTPRGRVFCLAVDRILVGSTGGYADPRYLLADLEQLAWHRRQAAWRAVNGLRAFLAQHGLRPRAA